MTQPPDMHTLLAQVAELVNDPERMAEVEAQAQEMRDDIEAQPEKKAAVIAFMDKLTGKS